MAWEVSGVGKFEEKGKKTGGVRGAGDGRRSIGTVSARWSWTKKTEDGGVFVTCMLHLHVCMPPASLPVPLFFLFFLCAQCLVFFFLVVFMLPTPLYICMIVVEG